MTKKKMLVIQHRTSEGLGLLEPCLTEKEWLLDVRNMEHGARLPKDLNACHAMLIMGGPMGAYEEKAYPYLYEVQNLIRLASRHALPTLGICLGAQLIARALGAHVGPHSCKEIGWFSLEINERERSCPLFNGIESPAWVFQWHQDSFAIPDGARLLASTRDCANQAFSYEDCLWGLQFHPEVYPQLISSWVKDDQEDFAGLPGEPGSEIIKATSRLWRIAHETNLQILHNLEIILSGQQ